MKQRWYTLDEAPLDKGGHLWAEECGDRTHAIGQVYEWETSDGGRVRCAVANWCGPDWTHWHPFPEPPQ